MNKQINLRLPESILITAQQYAEDNGYGTLQDFIKEAIREKVFEQLTKEELVLVSKLVAVSDNDNLYGTEEELFDKL